MVHARASRRSIAASLIALACAGAAAAGAPEPTKPVAASLYAGRWFEIARTPNIAEHRCAGATSDFSGLSGLAFSVANTCHVGAQAKVTRARATLLAGSSDAKFRMSFLGGLIHQEYWILDTGAAGDWAVMATPGGHYVWLLARRSPLPPAEKAEALARVAALGFPTRTLEFP